MNMTYQLRRIGGEPKCFVLSDGQELRELTPQASLKIVRHSPDGFEFGYGGSGPSQLALAILLDFCNEENLPANIAERAYMEFKWEFIAGATQQTDISSSKIKDFLKNKGAGIP